MRSSNSSSGFRTEGSDLSDIYVEASYVCLIKTRCKRDKKKSLNLTILIYTSLYAYLDLASTKSSYSPI